MRKATGSIRATRTTTSAKKSYLVDSAFRKASKFYPRRNQYETPLSARRDCVWDIVARRRNLRRAASPPQDQSFTSPAGNTGRFGVGCQDRSEEHTSELQSPMY